MSVLLLAFVLQAGSPAAVPEVWRPQLTWGCLVREGRKQGFVLNGVIARREEPNHPNVHRRDERALRVLRDDSGAFSGRQARWPMFVARRPDSFWAFFPQPGSAQFGPETGGFVLDVPSLGGRGRIELFDRSAPDTKPYATGECVSRVAPQEPTP